MNAIRMLLLSLLLVPSLAAADEVTCESIDGRRAECDMNTRGEVRLVRQLSRTACVQDQNWGLNRSSIWVDRGCRGVFASANASPGRYDGGSSYGGAPQGGQSPNQVTCESIGGQRTECDMNTRGVVVVQRQLSRTACVQDQNWGLNRSSVWVSGGCRAVFALEGAGGRSPAAPPTRADLAREDAQYDSSGRAPPPAIRGCNDYAGQGRDGVLVSQNALRPGNWEIVLRFGDDRYVCNVTSGGQVSEFQQIN
jgi:hypothetical protein